VVATVGATVVGGAVGPTVVGAMVVDDRVVVGSTVVVGAIVVVATVVVVTGGGEVGGTVVVGASVVVGATVVVVVAAVVVVTGGVVPSVLEKERIGPAPTGPIASTVKVKGIPRFSPIAETASDVDAVVMLSPKLVVIL
jgi:UDP-3-O-[3-hydroxymyristoyl] glucosamine N-acyltransferase